MKPRKNTNRLQFLDWTRGLAAVIMLQGHAFHSLLRNDLRTTNLFLVSDFLGGMPSAMFLFLTGITLSFLIDSRERQGAPAGERIRASLRRAGYILAIAIVVRVQLWLFALPGSHWPDLFRVDILNAMGLGLAVMSPLAVFGARARARWGAVVGLAIACASPLASQMVISSPLIRSYLLPDYTAFGFFPWAAFIAFGISAGSIIRLLNDRQMDGAMQWCALGGGGLLIGSQFLANSPYSLYNKSEFWLNSPLMILGKLGAILLILAFAFLWTKYAGDRWSWVRQLGTTSLLVYWVHIELVYGRWLGPWHANLDLAQSSLAAATLIGCMVLVSSARARFRSANGPAVKGWWSNWFRQPVPERVSGD